jgi:RNA polymerase sigma-70 factor (ECF subfamily)
MLERNEDDELMRKAADGDAVAFDQIVVRHQHRLQRYVSRMLGGDSSRAGDVAVGTFLRLWEVRSTYQPCGKLEAWLLRTATRRCLDLLDQESRITQIDSDRPDPIPCPSSQLESSALGQAVKEAIAALPEAQRAVLILSVYEDLTYEQISEALDIPVGTVASRRHHALTSMRKQLASWEER